MQEERKELQMECITKTKAEKDLENPHLGHLVKNEQACERENIKGVAKGSFDKEISIDGWKPGAIYQDNVRMTSEAFWRSSRLPHPLQAQNVRGAGAEQFQGSSPHLSVWCSLASLAVAQAGPDATQAVLLEVKYSKS